VHPKLFMRSPQTPCNAHDIAGDACHRYPDKTQGLDWQRQQVLGNPTRLWELQHLTCSLGLVRAVALDRARAMPLFLISKLQWLPVKFADSEGMLHEHATHAAVAAAASGAAAAVAAAAAAGVVCTVGSLPKRPLLAVENVQAEGCEDVRRLLGPWKCLRLSLGPCQPTSRSSGACPGPLPVAAVPNVHAASVTKQSCSQHGICSLCYHCSKYHNLKIGVPSRVPALEFLWPRQAAAVLRARAGQSYEHHRLQQPEAHSCSLIAAGTGASLQACFRFSVKLFQGPIFAMPLSHRGSSCHR